MNRIFWITVFLLLEGCGRRGDSPVAEYPYQLPDDLVELRSMYKALAPAVQDQWGFVDSDKCDSLLYTALLGSSGVDISDLGAAESPAEPGKWVRRPQFRPGAPAPCFIPPDTDNGSKSSISRDMLLGVMWYAWRHSDRPMLERLYSYGSAHNWTMGEGDATRTGLRTLRGTLVAEIAALGGERRPFDELIADPELFALDSYAAHLQVLHILLSGEIYGRLSDHSVQILATLADQNPMIPIMQAAAARWVGGQYAWKFLVAIRQQTLFPASHLPTSLDRCTNWITNQSNTTDLLPCYPSRTHSGGDALFAMYIYTGSAE